MHNCFLNYTLQINCVLCALCGRHVCVGFISLFTFNFISFHCNVVASVFISIFCYHLAMLLFCCCIGFYFFKSRRNGNDFVDFFFSLFFQNMIISISSFLFLNFNYKQTAFASGKCIIYYDYDCIVGHL